MKQQIEFYLTLFKNIKETKKSINFFFSHYNTEENFLSLISNILANLSPQELVKDELKSVLEHMQKLAIHKKLLAINPLNKDRLHVLH